MPVELIAYLTILGAGLLVATPTALYNTYKCKRGTNLVPYAINIAQKLGAIALVIYTIVSGIPTALLWYMLISYIFAFVFCQDKAKLFVILFMAIYSTALLSTL